MNNFYIHCFISTTLLAPFFSVTLPPSYSATIKAVSEDTSQTTLFRYLDAYSTFYHIEIKTPMTPTRPAWLQMTLLLPNSVLTPCLSLLVHHTPASVFPKPVRLLSFSGPRTSFLGYFLLVLHIDVFLSLRLDCNAVVCWSCLTASSLGKGSHDL